MSTSKPILVKSGGPHLGAAKKQGGEQTVIFFMLTVNIFSTLSVNIQMVTHIISAFDFKLILIQIVGTGRYLAGVPDRRETVVCQAGRHAGPSGSKLL